MPHILKRPLPAALAIGLLAWLAFVYRLAVPHAPVFDEVHYLPAARTLLALSGSTNIEHPLLGKALIAAGIATFGDTPFGWRIASTLAGASIVVSVFAILHLIFGRLRTSAFGALLAALNFTVYIQARIAMLDGFMAAFLMAGIACTLWAMRRGGWTRYLAAAALLGLATACKWVAAPYVAFAMLAFWLLRRRGHFADLPIWYPFAFGAVAVAAYLATFAPAFLYAHDPLTLARLIPFQFEMLARQRQILPPHTYQSDWWTWPLLIRPIWYLYEPVDGAQRGILMLGNPVLMWSGLVAVAACLWAGVRGSASLLGIALLWIASVAIWAAIPKSLGFYYYYYVSSIVLTLAIAAAFDHWRMRLQHWDESYAIAAIGVFVYFYPVLSAQPLANPDAFHHWTWFASWV